jgi:BirA family biotin operon repressor/biotin-[acetyl-CoA-carboxylase] ligase
VRITASVLELDEVGSTQDLAAELIAGGDKRHSVVYAHNQVGGKGRLGRTWESKREESLTMTMIFWEYADWEKPWLIGMTVSLAAAELLHCTVRWPNDLTFGSLKVGGLLSEIHLDPQGRRVPTVGIGINLLQESFPADLPNAISVFRAKGERLEAVQTSKALLDKITAMPEPTNWSDIEPLWRQHDATPGKHYRLADGRETIAVRVTDHGSLLCKVDGAEMTVMAAEAIFGV